jgi:HTH-type transcriptional regulator / antitoxin MqsA
MSPCICGTLDLLDSQVDESFEIQGKTFQVREIPVKLCPTCGDMTFSREVTENLRKSLNRQPSPEITDFDYLRLAEAQP